MVKVFREDTRSAVNEEGKKTGNGVVFRRLINRIWRMEEREELKRSDRRNCR